MRVETRPVLKIRGMNNWEIIEEGIKEQKITEQGILEQHYTTICKLHTARNHLTKLGKKIPTRRITDLPIRIVEGKQKEVQIEWLDGFETKAEECLKEFDGFFYSLRGCLDSFFWEINLIFKLGFAKISHKDVKNAMEKKHN